MDRERTGWPEWFVHPGDKPPRSALWIAVILILYGACPSRSDAQEPAAAGWTAVWIQAPWSTVRDGAEPDGSHPMPVFRRDFRLPRKPVKAQLVIAGLGQYEAHLNGHKVGSAVVAQAWTDYRNTVTYDTYDVASQLHAGRNVLGVLLGNGMYNVQKTAHRYTKFEGSYGPPKLIAELRLRYADGGTVTIATDTRWKAARGPIVFSSTYGGEDFDARRMPQGWNEPVDNDDHWQEVMAVSGPGGRLEAALAPPLRVHERYSARQLDQSPVRSAPASSTRTVYDLGQNFAGWPRITVRGEAGATLRLVPGELLSRDGSVSQRSSGGPQWWSYTLRGGGVEEWEPRFSFYGFRYVQTSTLR